MKNCSTHVNFVQPIMNFKRIGGPRENRTPDSSMPWRCVTAILWALVSSESGFRVAPARLIGVAGFTLSPDLPLKFLCSFRHT